MKNILTLLAMFCLGVSPLAAQQTIFLQHDPPIQGTILWDRSKDGDQLFFLQADSAGDTLVQFVPSRKVEYIDCDSCKYVYKGRRHGWQPWKGQTFAFTPQHGMLYGISGGIITDGWSVDASAMRYLNRSNFFGIGFFVRYAESSPFRREPRSIQDAYGYSYNNQSISFGGQVELRGYSRKLRTFYYLDLGLGVTYHQLSDWTIKWREEKITGIYGEEYWENYYAGIFDFPMSKWGFAFHAKAGIYTRLTKGFYVDLSVGCMGRIIDHTTSEVVSYFKTSDKYPFGVSLGLRFGKEN